MNAGLTKWLKSGLSAGTIALCAALLTAVPCVYSEEPAPTPAMEPTPVTEPVPIPKPVTVPASAATDAETIAKQLLEQQAVSDIKLRQEAQAQSSQHFQSGKELFSQFEYEEAQRELVLAVKMDRTHKEARELLTRVNDVLNQRVSRIGAAIRNLSNTHKVMAQEKLVDLDNRIDWGKKFMQIARDSTLSMSDRIRKYEQALNAFERARELIKYMPFELTTDEQSNEVNRLISEVQKAIKAAEVNLKSADALEAQRMAQEQRESVRRAYDRKLNIMVDQARVLHETGNYEAALNMANKILEIDPTNAEANSIIAVSRDDEHKTRKKWYEDEYNNQYVLNREAAEARNVPHKDYVVYPPNWKEISQRQGQEFKHKEEEAWKQEIRKKLSRKVAFEFVDTPLEEAIAFLNTSSHANILLDPKAEANKTPITLRVQDMELETALKWVLRAAELEYDLRAQAVFVTKKISLGNNLETEVYDIKDLTTAVPDFPGPHIEIGTSASKVDDPFKNIVAAPQLQGADLQTLIKEKLLPAEFADPATSIEEHNGQLIVVQRPEVHDRIQQLLRSFRESQTIQVLTQVRYIDVNDGFLEQIGVHFAGLDAAPGDAGVANAAVDPLRQPSRYGIFPAGGGPGTTSLPSDVQPSAAFQFANFQTSPPFSTNYGGLSTNPAPGPITLIRPRLDPNYPNQGGTGGTAGQGSNAPAGLRRQWWSNALRSPVLTQAITQNMVRLNPIASALGGDFANNPSQGLLMQVRFLQSTQANAIIQAVRKDSTTDQLLAPKLMQFNNQRSHILVADQKSYIKNYTVSGSAYDPQISTYLTGVVLELKPTVSNDKRYITMDVRTGTAADLGGSPPVYITNSGSVTTGAVGTSSTNLQIELPNLELRSISTSVTVPDSGTMLMSGLITDHKFDSKTGVPFFSDLPFIGRIFSTNHKERVRRNLLILINSHVVLFDEEEANRL